MIVQTKDGVKVEMGYSSNGASPDQVGGQHTNCGSMWYRIEGGKWIESTARSQMQTKNTLLSNTYEDAVKILTPGYGII